MKRIDELREQIDACRPASDDLHLPELAGLRRALDTAQAVEQDRAVVAEFDRAQRFDRNVMSALHEVPVPAGMLERLLAKTAEESRVERRVTVPMSRLSRRWMLTAGSLACVAAVALLAAFLAWPRTSAVMTEDYLANQIDTWMNEATVPAGWSREVAAAPAAFKFDSAVQAGPTLWRNYRTPAGDRAVVYDVTPPRGGGGRALLFVVSTRATYAVPSLPFKSLTGATGGVQVGAWQRGGLLYVLVVAKGGPSIEQLVKRPRVT